MTVGIAAICKCDSETFVVTCSDRMVTVPGLLQVELARRKTVELTRNCVGLLSGSDDGEAVLLEARTALQMAPPNTASGPPTIQQITELVTALFARNKAAKT